MINGYCCYQQKYRDTVRNLWIIDVSVTLSKALSPLITRQFYNNLLLVLLLLVHASDDRTILFTCHLPLHWTCSSVGNSSFLFSKRRDCVIENCSSGLEVFLFCDLAVSMERWINNVTIVSQPKGDNGCLWGGNFKGTCSHCTSEISGFNVLAHINVSVWSLINSTRVVLEIEGIPICTVNRSTTLLQKSSDAFVSGLWPWDV